MLGLCRMLQYASGGGAVLCDCCLAGAGVCRHQHTLPALDAAHRLLLERVELETVSTTVTVEKGGEVNTRKM